MTNRVTNRTDIIKFITSKRQRVSEISEMKTDRHTYINQKIFTFVSIYILMLTHISNIDLRKYILNVINSLFNNILCNIRYTLSHVCM